MVDHGVVVRRLPAACLAEALRLGVRVKMHVGEVHPDEEGLVVVDVLLDEALGLLCKVVVAGQHPLRVQRSGVFDLLLADLAPAWMHRRVVDVGCEAVDDAAWLHRLDEVAELFLGEVVVHLRFFFGIEMVEVAVELVEAVIGRQHAVQVAEMVLAELAGAVALVLQKGGNRNDLVAHADRCGRDSHFRQTGAHDALTGDERRAARRAGLLAVAVGEHHAFLGEAIDVGCLVPHQAARVATQIRDADIVAPYHQDIGLFCLCHSIFPSSFVSSRLERNVLVEFSSS